MLCYFGFEKKIIHIIIFDSHTLCVYIGRHQRIYIITSCFFCFGTATNNISFLMYRLNFWVYKKIGK